MLDLHKGDERVGIETGIQKLNFSARATCRMLSLSSEQTLKILIKGKNNVFGAPNFDPGDSQSREKFLGQGLIQGERLGWGGAEDSSTLVLSISLRT